MTLLKLFLFTIATFSSAFSMDPHENRTPNPLRVQQNIQPKDLAMDATITVVWYTFRLDELPTAYAAVEKNSALNPEQKKRMKEIALNVIQKRLHPVMNYVNEKICVYDLLIKEYNDKKDEYLTKRKKLHDFKNSFMGFLTSEQKNFDPTNLIEALKNARNAHPNPQQEYAFLSHLVVSERNYHYLQPSPYIMTSTSENCQNDWDTLIRLEHSKSVGDR